MCKNFFLYLNNDHDHNKKKRRKIFFWAQNFFELWMFPWQEEKSVNRKGQGTGCNGNIMIQYNPLQNAPQFISFPAAFPVSLFNMTQFVGSQYFLFCFIKKKWRKHTKLQTKLTFSLTAYLCLSDSFYKILLCIMVNFMN